MDLTIGLVLLALFAALFLIPLGLPGLWVQVGVLTIATFFDRFAPELLIGVLLLAILGEAAEYWFVKRLTARYGGSRKAFWGALAGGMLGMFVGIPIPILGSVVAGILGSFAGAVVVAYWETKDLAGSGRVGWGVVLGRVFAAAAKLAAGVCILVAAAAGLLLR